MQTHTGYCNGLYYEVAGASEAVLFIHGFSLDTRMWDDQFEVFAQRYRVIRPDLRGFGKTPPPTGEYANTADLKAVLESLGEARAHIVGLSMGGGVALDLAITYPQIVRSLVLVDSAMGGFPYKSSFGVGAKEVGLEAAKQRWLAHPLFASANRIPAVAARLGQIVADYSGWHWLNRDPGRVPDPLPYHRLDEVTAPTLVLVGELDVLDFQAIAETLEQGIRGARKVEIQGAGHMSNMEAPEKFNEAVLGFLSTHTSTPPSG
jgi:pimeloyl-ACP methyl ester carboxylesterase